MSELEPSTPRFYNCFTSRGEIGEKLKKVRRWSNPGRITVVCRTCKAVIEKRNFLEHLKTKHPKPKKEVEANA